MQTRRWRLFWGSCSALQIAALILTFSKGALFLGLPAIFITLGLGGGVYLWRQQRSMQPLWLLAGVALIVVLALIPFQGAERFQRLFDFNQGTSALRIHLWRSAWQMALEHPLVGVGPDNFLYAYRSQYILPAAWQEPNLNHPHNWLLDWWTRLGIPGLLIALGLFARIVVNLWRNLWANREPDRAPWGVLGLGLLAATVGALSHGLIDASYALPDLMMVWVLILIFAEDIS